MAVCIVLVIIGAAVLLTIIPIVTLLLMTGPLLAMAGLIVGLGIASTVVAILLAGPPTAIGGGLALTAVIRDFTS